MRRFGKAILALGATSLALGLAPAQDDARGKDGHLVLAPDDIRWSEGPEVLPPGAKAALIEGDLKKEGFFALRLKLPADYKIAPHWHPAFERVTVISGTGYLGMGKTFDESKARELPAGSYFSLPPRHAHFFFTREETVIQINTNGPWDLIYFNPQDDPRRQQRP